MAEAICQSVFFTINVIHDVLFSFTVTNKSVLESTGIVAGKDGQVLVNVTNTGQSKIEVYAKLFVGATEIDRAPEAGMPNINPGETITLDGLYMKNMPSTPTAVKVEVCAQPTLW